MATKKRISNKGENPEKLVTEKDEAVEVASLLKDERTFKILGIGLLFFCLFLFVAFTSYLFTWTEDQDKIRDSGIKILLPNDLEIANQLGSLGAYTAFVFIEFGFGIASYLFCSLLFVLGVNMLFEKTIFSVPRNLRYLIVGLIVLSVSTSFFGASASFNWGGAFGKFISAWLVAVLGWYGTLALICFAVIAYGIWRFNPSLVWPVEGISAKNTENIVSPVLEEDVLPEDLQPRLDLTAPGNTQVPVRHGQSPSRAKSIAEVENDAPFELVHKTEDTPVELTSPADDLPLEMAVAAPGLFPLESQPVQPVAPAIKEPVSVLGTPKYDPIADLKGYKYPSLDLLAQHSGEKIVMDQHELEANKNQIMRTLKNYYPL
jgi:S-DNA-T family DNA segregation ATPase FtsK/SpoIIIE